MRVSPDFSRSLALANRVRHRAVRFAILFSFLLVSVPLARAQDNITEANITALFISGGSTTPLYLVGGNNYIILGSSNAGWIVSAAYYMGGGLYLYAYELICDSNYSIYIFDVTQLIVPLGGNSTVPTGLVTTGAFWIGGASQPYPTYTQVFAPFLQYASYSFYGVIPLEDPVTGAVLAGNPSSPSQITFQLFASLAPSLVPPFPLPVPPGVANSTAVFGFISKAPPRVLTGSFAVDSSGVPLPPFQMVVPGGITLLDPVPDLINSSNPPTTPLTADPNALATKGRLVQGAATDGVTEVLLRIPAGNAGDQFALSLKNFASTNDDGAFGDPLNLPASGPTQSNVTVTAVNTSQGAMAFALYRAPKDFAQTSVQGVACATRVETIQVQITPKGTSTTATTSIDITIMRPPLVLVHGLWSNKAAWNNFSPLFTSNGADPCFAVQTADYSQFQSALVSPPIVASTPPYADAGVLQAADSSALGFAFNTYAVFAETNQFINDFKNGQNALQIPVAAVQADFVAHSMGGDIVRTMPFFLGSNFYNEYTFGQGQIHKLITIGTPHLGSPLATQLAQNANTCIRNLLARPSYGLPSFSSVTFASGYIANGAMFDLSGDGSGGALSQALLNIFFQGQAQLIPAAMIAGVQPDLSSLDNSAASSAIRNIICPTDYLANHLTSTGWPTIVSNNSDAVVPLTSQWDGQSGIQQNGVIHSAQLARLGFAGYGELDPGSGIPAQVILLLNTPVTNLTSFKQLTP